MTAKIIAIAASLIAITAFAAMLATQGIMHGEQAQISRQTRQLARLESRVGLLHDQLSAISQPSDPLSAYNLICNQQFTNSQTGVPQSYYFPCTSNVQTIPQPGG